MAAPPLPPLNLSNQADLGDTSIQNGGINTGGSGGGWPFSSSMPPHPTYSGGGAQQLIPGVSNEHLMLGLAVIVFLKMFKG